MMRRYADNPGVLTVLRKEVIFRSNGSAVNVCLVRGSGLPFISALVLRTLDDDMYVDVKRAKLLILQWRWNAYHCCIDEIRYVDHARYITTGFMFTSRHVHVQSLWTWNEH